MPPAGGAACVTRTLIRTRSGAIARVCEGAFRRDLFGEADRNEGEDVVQCGLPVAPRVAAVAHPVLQRDIAQAHGFVEVDVGQGQEVVVAAVHPPADGALRGGLRVGEVADHLHGVVVGKRRAAGVISGVGVGVGVG